MSRKLRVTYFRNVCLGNANCVKNDSDHFSINEGKALLKDSKDMGDESFILERKYNDKEYNRLLEAAKACPVNAITVYDFEKNAEIVGNKIRFSSGYKEIPAEYDDSKDFKLDENGYFLIRVDRKNKNIEVAFCKGKNIVELKVVGKKPIEIYHTIINQKIISQPSHAAYLGRELQKAYIALDKSIEYIQDDELDFSKKYKEANL